MAHTRFKLRRGTAGEWAVTNPVLADGEPGIETDTGQVKFGNGADSWADRPYTTDYATKVLVHDVTRYGAKGDRVTDDTAAIQAAIDAAEAANGGIVWFPVGTYLTSSTLEYVGTSATTITLSGVGRAGRGPRGAVIKWNGAAGGTTMRLRGGQTMVVSGLAFTAGANAPLYDLDLVSDQPAGGSGLANVRVEDCHFGAASGVDSAFIRIGDSNFQADTVLIASCTLAGNEVQPTYGVLTATANAKNFAVRNTEIIGCQTGYYHGGAGYLTFDSCGFSSNQVADIRAATGQISVRGCGSEGSVRFITGTTGTNHGSVSVLNSYFDSDLVPLDDYVITYEGALFLEGSSFNNRRAAGAIAKVKGGGLTGASSSSIVSIGNFYLNAAGSAPLYDGSGNQWKTRLEASTGTALHVLSFSDLGGAPGALAGLTAGWADDMIINDISVADLFARAARTGLVAAPASTTLYIQGAATAGYPVRVDVANGGGTLTRRIELHGSGTQLKDAAAATMVDIGASKLGFFGTAAVAKPSLTYSRTGETTAEAQLRTALAALGLVTDSTTA